MINNKKTEGSIITFKTYKTRINYWTDEAMRNFKLQNVGKHKNIICIFYNKQYYTNRIIMYALSSKYYVCIV